MAGSESSANALPPAVGAQRVRWWQRPFRFSLRGLMLLTFMAALPFSWLYNAELVPAREQRLAVHEIRRSGGRVTYAYTHPNNWLSSWLGEDLSLRVRAADVGNLGRRDGSRRRANGNENIRRLPPLRGLSHVDAMGETVTDEGLRPLLHLRELQSLNLSHSAVTDTGLATISRMSNLTALDLADTAITDAGLGQIAGLQNLRRLSLDETDITDAGLMRLAEMQSLECLSLQGTNVTDGALAELALAVSVRELDVTLTYEQLGADDVELLLALPRIRRLRVRRADWNLHGASISAHWSAELENLTPSFTPDVAFLD